MPVPANTTCDVYRSGSVPPADPAVAGVPCRLEADYARRMEVGETMSADYRFTHVLLVDPATDIRDANVAFVVGSTGDDVYVPDRNGTRFRVVMVELHYRNSPTAVRRVYLDRYQPVWPTNEL